jgi:predicted HTH domain antitoxin
MGVQIAEDVLRKVDMTADEFLIEIAVHLYDIGKMTMGQARNFAGIDQITFQGEMAKRDVYMKYSIEDFEDDLKTIEELEKLR